MKVKFLLVTYVHLDYPQTEFCPNPRGSLRNFGELIWNYPFHRFANAHLQQKYIRALIRVWLLQCNDCCMVSTSLEGKSREVMEKGARA